MAELSILERYRNDTIRFSYANLVKTKADENVTQWKLLKLAKIYELSVEEIQDILKAES